jgi:hypothetical protein
LLDGSESIGDRLAGLDLMLFIGKHPLNDLTDRVLVVYHYDVIAIGFWAREPVRR